MAEPARERREMKARRMSNYGVKSYTPEQTKEQWRESMRVCNVSCILINDFKTGLSVSFFFFFIGLHNYGNFIVCQNVMIHLQNM